MDLLIKLLFQTSLEHKLALCLIGQRKMPVSQLTAWLKMFHIELLNVLRNWLNPFSLSAIYTAGEV